MGPRLHSRQNLFEAADRSQTAGDETDTAEKQAAPQVLLANCQRHPRQRAQVELFDKISLAPAGLPSYNFDQNEIT